MIGLLSILAVGFFLGMRHATDPDHVIAVSTIVTRNRNLGRAALIGAFWGLGHTITFSRLAPELSFSTWSFLLALDSAWNCRSESC